MSSLDEELAALEAEDEASEASIEAARAEQAKVDRIAFLRLKKEHGEHMVGVVPLGSYKPGYATQLVVIAMDGMAYGRFEQMSQAQSAAKRRQAIKCAVSDCLKHPDAKTFAAMAADFHDLPGTVALAAVKLSKGRAAIEGKE